MASNPPEKDETDWDRWILRRGPIENRRWYHVDETGEEYGPFDTKEEAIYRLKDYCFWLENGLTKYAAQMAHGV